MKPHAFIFMGRAGGGKGTQADLLMKLLKKTDPSHPSIDLQPGKEFRSFVQGAGFTETIAKQINDSGGLQPEFLPIYMWTRLIVKDYTGEEHLVFDGAPRKLLEAHVLNTIFDFYGIEKPIVIHLDVEHGEATKRLLIRGRVDDTHEGIKNRLSLYDTDVTPTVAYYRDNPRYSFMDIDGNRPIEAIHADIVKRLGLV